MRRRCGKGMRRRYRNQEHGTENYHCTACVQLVSTHWSSTQCAGGAMGKWSVVSRKFSLLRSGWKSWWWVRVWFSSSCAGTFSDTSAATNQTACQPCGVGRFSTKLGANRASEYCLNCPKGRYGDKPIAGHVPWMWTVSKRNVVQWHSKDDSLWSLRDWNFFDRRASHYQVQRVCGRNVCRRNRFGVVQKLWRRYPSKRGGFHTMQVLWHGYVWRNTRVKKLLAMPCWIFFKNTKGVTKLNIADWPAFRVHTPSSRPIRIHIDTAEEHHRSRW